MALKSSFRNYFLLLINLIRNSFNMKVTNAKFFIYASERYSREIVMQYVFETKIQQLANFSLLLRSNYPALANKAPQNLIPFCRTYLRDRLYRYCCTWNQNIERNTMQKLTSEWNFPTKSLTLRFWFQENNWYNNLI